MLLSANYSSSCVNAGFGLNDRELCVLVGWTDRWCVGQEMTVENGLEKYTGDQKENLSQERI